MVCSLAWGDVYRCWAMGCSSGHAAAHPHHFPTERCLWAHASDDLLVYFSAAPSTSAAALRSFRGALLAWHSLKETVRRASEQWEGLRPAGGRTPGGGMPGASDEGSGCCSGCVCAGPGAETTHEHQPRSPPAVSVKSSGKPAQSQDRQTPSCGLVARPRRRASCLGLSTTARVSPTPWRSVGPAGAAAACG